MAEKNSSQEKVLTAERLVNLLILLIGVIVSLVGGFVIADNVKTQTILISIGTSIIASSLVAFLSSIYIKKYRTAKQLAEEWGISSIEDKRTIMNIRIDENLANTKHKYDIMAFGLKSLREGNSKAVESALIRGTNIRILSVNPELEELNKVDVQENKKRGSTSDSIKELISWVEKLESDFPGQCEIRLANYLPSQFYCREDDSIYVGPYQYGKESQQAITTEYKNPGKGFFYFNSYFDSLWDDTNYCKKSKLNNN